MTHHCIEVTHQCGIRYFTCESFWDRACELGLDYAEIDLEFDKVSPDVETLIKQGKHIVRMYENGEPTIICDIDTLDKEYEGKKYLMQDLNTLIVIDTLEDAEHYANNYKGHEWVKVRFLARSIYETMKIWED